MSAADEETTAQLTISAKIWKWRDDNSFNSGKLFFYIEEKDAGTFRRMKSGKTPTIGPTPIFAMIGESRWKTMAVDASSHAGYLVEVDRAVASKEDIAEGSDAKVTISFREAVQ